MIFDFDDERRLCIGQFVDASRCGAAAHIEDLFNFLAGKTARHCPDSFQDLSAKSIDVRLDAVSSVLRSTGAVVWSNGSVEQVGLIEGHGAMVD